MLTYEMLEARREDEVLERPRPRIEKQPEEKPKTSVPNPDGITWKQYPYRTFPEQFPAWDAYQMQMINRVRARMRKK